MTHNNRKLGQRQQDILTALFEDSNAPRAIADMAKAAGMTKRQVQRTSDSLIKAGLLEQAAEGEIRMTDAGYRVAQIGIEGEGAGTVKHAEPVEESTPEPTPAPKPVKNPRGAHQPKLASIMGDKTLRLPVGALPFPLPRVTVLYAATTQTIAARPAVEGEKGQKATAAHEGVGAVVHISRALREAGLDIADAKGRYETERNGPATVVRLDRKVTS